MKPNKRKAVVSDPIKRIGLNGGNSAREIVIQIAKALGFKIHEDDKGVSAYGGNAIRIADHCTYMQTWVDNGTWNAPIRLDVVIEDEPTEAVTQVRIGYDFGITEFVSQSNDIDPQNARMIAYDIRNTMNGNPYANNVRGERRNLVATHGNNPQELNCNTNMNKKLIRLTESDLHKIVKRSVNKVLRESYNDDDVYMSNYRDAMSDREESYTIDDLFRELKEEGYDFLKYSYPDAWQPGNWMQVMQVAEKLGYPEDIKELIIHEIELNISFEQKNLDYVKNYKWRT